VTSAGILAGAFWLSRCENHQVGEELTFEQAAALDAESFRAYYLSDLLQRARSRMSRSGGVSAESPGQVGWTQKLTARRLGVTGRQYREFERGRVVHSDPRFLDEVARVLKMSAAERDILYRLGMRRPALVAGPSRADLSDMQPMLDSLEQIPALITDAAWNVLAWNRADAETLQDPRELPEESRNAMLWMFTPTAEARFPQVRDEYQLLVGRVRSAYLAGMGRSTTVQGLVERLVANRDAARQWNNGALALEPINQQRLLRDPEHGPRRVHTLTTLLPEQGIRVIEFVPHRPA
jgi:transcriptional regulator with XRE-family HTH domain